MELVIWLYWLLASKPYLQTLVVYENYSERKSSASLRPSHIALFCASRSDRLPFPLYEESDLALCR